MQAVAATAPVRFEDGFVKWFDGSKAYALTEAAFEVLSIAAAALSQPGVIGPEDPVVSLYLSEHLPATLVRNLDLHDRRQLIELGYGFVFTGV